MGRKHHANTRRGLLAALGVTGLATLAGCSGGEETTAANAPPSGTPTPQSTATADGMALPPGTSEAGLDDVSALVSATQSALRANDYAIRSVVPVSGTATVTVTIRSSLTQERHLFVFDAPSETNRRYVADGTSHLQATADGGTTYSTGTADEFTAVHENVDQVSMLGSGEALGGILRTGSYAPAGPVSRDGRRLYEFALESADLEGATAATAAGGASVDGDGVVFEAALPYTLEGADESVDWSFTIETLGDVAVSEPEWVRSDS